jgi:O-antigen ligase
MVRGMLYTMSRGAYLALASGTAVVLLVRSPLYLLLSAALALGVPEFAPSLVPSSVMKRLQVTREAQPLDPSLTVGLDTSSQQRLMLWNAGIEMIRDHPWSGVGLFRFTEVVDYYVPTIMKEKDPRDAHNAYIKVAAEMGIPALVVMVVLLLWIGASSLIVYFRREHLFDRSVALALLGSLVGVIVSCIFGSRFTDESLMGPFWALVGMLRVLGHLPATVGPGRDPE